VELGGSVANQTVRSDVLRVARTADSSGLFAVHPRVRDRLEVGASPSTTIVGPAPGAVTSAPVSSAPGSSAPGSSAPGSSVAVPSAPAPSRSARIEVRGAFEAGVLTISGPRPPADAESALIDAVRRDLGEDRVRLAWRGTAQGIVDSAMYGRIGAALVALGRTDPMAGLLDVRSGIGEVTATVASDADRSDLIQAVADALGGVDLVRPVIAIGGRPSASSAVPPGSVPGTSAAVTVTTAPTSPPPASTTPGSTTPASTTPGSTTPAPSTSRSVPATTVPGAAELQRRLDALLATRRVSFQTDLAVLDGPGAATVDALAEVLRGSGLRVEVGGHTDNRGDAAKNQQLSEQRAAAVVRALAERGVAATRLVAVGYGSSEPIADNGTREGQARNRRISVRVLGPA
jgi:outer membrane protein OmpA-like peptidoglycan-associated protein